MVPETSFSRIVPTNSKVLLYGLRLCGKGRSYLKGTEIQKGKWGGGGEGGFLPFFGNNYKLQLGNNSMHFYVFESCLHRFFA